MRVEIMKAEAQRLLRQAPFHPFAVNLENGDRVIIEHPENIAFDPVGRNGTGGSAEFHVISSSLRYVSTFDAVTSVAILDRDEVA
ncbi:MAG TPA: hypothetical protein VF278_09900 [Pirellulales bacterium]